MLDPITLYAAKVAFTTGGGGLLTGLATVQAQTSAGFDAGTAVTAATGVAMLAAGVWKLLGDHTAVEREHATMQARIQLVEAELDAAEAKLSLAVQHSHRIELAAARAGVYLAELNIPDPDIDS